MSYYGTVGRGLPGFTEGMGASFPIGSPSVVPANEGLRVIQQNLQRMGVMPAGTGPTGADGRFGFHTAHALTQAGTRLGRTTPASRFTLARGGRSVDIPDDFIAAIQAAATAPDPAHPAGPDPSTTPPLPALPSGLPATTEATPLPPVVEPPSRTRLYLMIGGAVVVLGGVATYALWPAKKSTPNRRRHVRRNRRRRTSRR